MYVCIFLCIVFDIISNDNTITTCSSFSYGHRGVIITTNIFNLNVRIYSNF